MEKLHKKNRYYMGWYDKDDVIKYSSSGGAFTALAEAVYNLNGIVCGACYDFHDWSLKHIMVDKTNLHRIRSSKYFQSDTREIYGLVETELKNRRPVLFSGTACQIAGIKSYLELKKIITDDLYTVDVLCHGVTSKEVIMRYKSAKEKKYSKKIKELYFRVKGDVRWEKGGGTSTKLVFSDESSVVPNRETDSFFVAFNSNLILRPSCYSCCYTKVDRVSDITIADCWGVTEEYVDEKNLENGVSLLSINSEKGAQLMEMLPKDFHYELIDPYLFAFKSNEAFDHPQKKHKLRDAFFQHFRKENFDRLVFRLEPYPFISGYVQGIVGPRASSIIRRVKHILK